MAVSDKSIQRLETFFEWGIVYSLCAVIFALPFSIALLDSFAALAIVFYIAKKISHMTHHWPASGLGLKERLCFIWKGFCPPENFLNRPLQFLSLAVFISVVFSQYPALSFLAFIGKFLKVIFLYFCLIEVINDHKRLESFLTFMLLSSYLVVLSGIAQHFSGYDFLRGHALSGGRANASFFSANGLAAYLLPVIALVAHFLFKAVCRRSWLTVLGWAFFLGMVLACLCWTYSRASWLGFLVIVLVMCMLDRRKTLLGAILLLVFIFIFLPALNDVRHLYLINDNSLRSTAHHQPVVHPSPSKANGFSAKAVSEMDFLLEQGGSGRRHFWDKAVSFIRLSPVHGTGLNTYGRMLKKDPDKTTWWYAHNSYLQMTAETGFLGLISFLWLIFVLLARALNACKQDIFLQAMISGLSGYLVQSFFDNTFFVVQLTVLLWLVIGLVVAGTRLPKESTGTSWVK